MVRTDRARGATRLADVCHVWGPGDRSRVYRLCGEVQPRILSVRLMVSLPVRVSCFDLNIVYTNMSGVTICDKRKSSIGFEFSPYIEQGQNFAALFFECWFMV